MDLRNKTILLISSEAWGNIYVSKHNYAIALAERGNRVYFLNPVSSSLKRGEIRCERSGVNENLFIITYNAVFPWSVKFHLPWLFDKLIAIQVKKIIKYLGHGFDIVWDFNCSYLYKNLKIFGAKRMIFHPVDHLAENVRKKHADLFVTISDNLLGQYLNTKVPRLKIGHGLSRTFEYVARLPVTDQKVKNEYDACYIGNLTIESLDREALLNIVTYNSSTRFHFIGPYEAKNNNIGGGELNEATVSFIDTLKAQKNVTLYGIRSQPEIASMLPEFDLFLICYKKTSNYSNDNSHKIMEYLSSGKVVVSSYLSSYKDSDLIVMCNAEENGYLPEMVKNVINNITYYNNNDFQKRRKQLALERTYEKNICDIETMLFSINAK